MQQRTRSRSVDPLTQATIAHAMGTDVPMESLLTERELAQFLRKSIEAVRKGRWRGTGPRHLRIAGSIRYRRSDVEKYLERCAE